MPAVDIAEIGAVGPLRDRRWCCAARKPASNLCRDGARAAARRRLRACRAATSGPTSTGFDGIAHVDDAVELVVLRVARLEVRRAGAMWTYSPSTNHSWWTPRECGPEASKNEIDFGVFGHADVEQFEARRLSCRACLHLVGDRHQVADDLERVGAHLRLRQSRSARRSSARAGR